MRAVRAVRAHADPQAAGSAERTQFFRCSFPGEPYTTFLRLAPCVPCAPCVRTRIRRPPAPQKGHSFFGAPFRGARARWSCTRAL